MKAIFEPFIIILKDMYIKYPDEITKNIVRIYETENTTDAKPVITKAHTKRYPIVSPTKNLKPSLNEKAAPTPAKARTAGPGVPIIKKLIKQMQSFLIQTSFLIL